MKRFALVLLLAGACQSDNAVGRMLDNEAMGRAMVNDKGTSGEIGGDAVCKASYERGSEFYIERIGEPGDRQIHFWSAQRNQTSIIGAKELRKYTRVRVLATYPGSPPPSARWVKKLQRKKTDTGDWDDLD